MESEAYTAVDSDLHGFEVEWTEVKFEDPILSEILSNFPDLLLNAMSSLQDWIDSSSLKMFLDEPSLSSTGGGGRGELLFVKGSKFEKNSWK